MNEYHFSEIQLGQTESFSKEITLEMENAFRQISGDINPLHADDDFAAEIGGSRFNKHVTFGMLTASLYSTMAGVYLPGKYSLIHSIDNMKFQKPVFAGDVLTVTGTVEEKQEGLNLIKIKVRITNQDAKCVSSVDMKILVQK